MRFTILSLHSLQLDPLFRCSERYYDDVYEYRYCSISSTESSKDLSEKRIAWCLPGPFFLTEVIAAGTLCCLKKLQSAFQRIDYWARLNGEDLVYVNLVVGCTMLFTGNKYRGCLYPAHSPCTACLVKSSITPGESPDTKLFNNKKVFLWKQVSTFSLYCSLSNRVTPWAQWILLFWRLTICSWLLTILIERANEALYIPPCRPEPHIMLFRRPKGYGQPVGQPMVQ